MKPKYQQFHGKMKVDKDCLDGMFVKGEHVIVSPQSGGAVLVQSPDGTKCGYVAMGEVSLDTVINEVKP